MTEVIEASEYSYKKKYINDKFTLESVSDIESALCLKDIRYFSSMNMFGYQICALGNESSFEPKNNLDKDSTTYIERYVVKRHREYVMSLSEYKDAMDSCGETKPVTLSNMEGLYLDGTNVSLYRRQGRKFYIRNLSFSADVFAHEGRYIIEEDNTTYEGNE